MFVDTKYTYCMSVSMLGQKYFVSNWTTPNLAGISANDYTIAGKLKGALYVIKEAVCVFLCVLCLFNSIKTVYPLIIT